MKKRVNTALILSGTSLVKAAALMALLVICTFSVSGLLGSVKPGNSITSLPLNQSSEKMRGELLYQFIGWENHYFTELNGKGASPKLTNLFLGLFANINLDDPRSLLGRELPGFYLFDSRIVVAGEGTNYTNMPIESAPPLEIMLAEREAALQNLNDIPAPEDNNGAPPVRWKEGVFIYFSHNRESYLPYLKGETDPNRAYHSKINVTQLGDQLKKSLEARGIGTHVDKTDINKNLVNKGLKFGNSYMESRNVVKEAMARNKELLYFIDVHRDAHRKKDTTKVINGKSYAKLAFVIGGENPHYQQNLKLAKEIHRLLEKNYPGLSRGIMLKEGAGTNGKFNQDLSGNAILVEFGGVDNTFEELNRSADALADVFADYFWQAESVENPISQPTDKK
ncbi:stage II sporulation protein P [Neobacillus notoginsengisoli]|uniref:Stage II sporulation protein P n=1 Tax=Neobacillus notoginsengisoli TaxID=1578198 RepID=A0A417YUL6_9BACI|nr:stage II sporulation protein P [Neobacillus notoginsengisoli]RHW40991.1 stage II sporulation protein P [Neobacillus notoginsengisoli]